MDTTRWAAAVLSVLAGCAGTPSEDGEAAAGTNGGVGDATSAGGTATTGDDTSGMVDSTRGTSPGTTAGQADGDTDDVKYDVGTQDVATPDCVTCSADFGQVVGCDGTLVEDCAADQACDLQAMACTQACTAAASNQASVGCEYWSTKMDHSNTYDALGVCFAAIVANTWTTPIHLEVEFEGVSLPVADFARIPSGAGPGLTLTPYDPVAGLPPDEVAIVFLSGPTGAPAYGKEPCPIAPAIAPEVMIAGTAIGSSFRIATDLPAVAYQMNPYGAGAGGAIAGASLLLPTSAWDDNYIGVMAYGPDLASEPPSMNIVATEDGTMVTILPIAAVAGGGGIPAGPAGVPLTFSLDRGQHAQFSQAAELTGSVVQSTAPIGLMAGHNGLRVPTGVPFADHAEQMIPPIRAWGSEYVGVMHRPRGTEAAVWRVIGAVDGTNLSWSSDVGGPASMQQGEVAEFITADPFVVSSQDEDHPFLLVTYMSGSGWTGVPSGAGDADFVIGVPPPQYLADYVFFMDPSYPEGNIVLVRSAVAGAFAPVELDCLGEVGGWQAVGAYEWTRVDMMTGDYQEVDGCSTGRHTIQSDAPFGLWVWGWGTSETSSTTANRSYGYPGGMNVRPINDVVIEPEG